MSVARHLHIDLAQYDTLIRTFIPYYDEMLDAAAGALTGAERLVVDLGIGSGALAGRCLRRAPSARIVGIDSDPGMLAAARNRLGDRSELVAGSFLRAPVPACDAIVASLALHHVRTRPAKQRLYARLSQALRSGGVIVSADRYPSRHRPDAVRERDEWVGHMRRTYSAAEAERYLRQWAREDVYVPLRDEIDLLERAGCAVEVPWRRGGFAVITAVARTR
jgi:trans-aconitate methyltransferase